MGSRGAKLAVQMYTVREFTKTGKGLAETLAKIAQMGYPAVQLSAVGCMNGETPEVSARQARQMLDDNGLKCIATHRAWDDLLNKTEKQIEFHHELGCDFAAIGGIPKDFGLTPEGFRRWLADAKPVIAALKKAGIRFGHHNHSLEFMRFPQDPRGTLHNILVDEGGPDLMLELDLYWIEHAGLHCERVVERCHGRLPVIHLKDKEVVADGPVMAPIGEGNMDWAHIVPACEAAGVRWYCMEQDTCRRDPFDCLKSSFAYMTGFGL
jgi:sugar phosphate isomerase/epimerase